MKLISIGTDRNLFKDGSAVRQRQAEYGKLFDELHIVVFTSGARIPRKVQIASNVWVYPTNSFSKFLYVHNAVTVAGSIIRERGLSKKDTVVTVQDPFESGLVGSKIRKKFGLPLHVQIHTDFMSPYFAKEAFLNMARVRIAGKVLPQADAVRVVSKRIGESIRGVGLRPDVHVQVLPIYSDIHKFESGKTTLDLRQKYPQFNFIILMASRLTHEKNIPFALRVFKRVLSAFPLAGLAVVGTGPERKKLETVVHSLGLEMNVVFEDWQNDLVSYYKTANMFLLTSLYEGYGLTLVEATAAGCPVVSSDVGVASILLQDGDSFVCPVDDPDCFVEKITKLINDTGLRLTFVQEAQGRLGKVTVQEKSLYLELYKQNIESALKK